MPYICMYWSGWLLWSGSVGQVKKQLGKVIQDKGVVPKGFAKIIHPNKI
jgi:hypothetical protein